MAVAYFAVGYTDSGGDLTLVHSTISKLPCDGCVWVGGIQLFTWFTDAVDLGECSGLWFMVSMLTWCGRFWCQA